MLIRVVGGQRVHFVYIFVLIKREEQVEKLTMTLIQYDAQDRYSVQDLRFETSVFVRLRKYTYDVVEAQ